MVECGSHLLLLLFACVFVHCVRLESIINWGNPNSNTQTANISAFLFHAYSLSAVYTLSNTHTWCMQTLTRTMSYMFHFPTSNCSCIWLFGARKMRDAKVPDICTSFWLKIVESHTSKAKNTNTSISSVLSVFVWRSYSILRNIVNSSG